MKFTSNIQFSKANCGEVDEREIRKAGSFKYQSFWMIGMLNVNQPLLPYRFFV